MCHVTSLNSEMACTKVYKCVLTHKLAATTSTKLTMTTTTSATTTMTEKDNYLNDKDDGTNTYYVS